MLVSGIKGRCNGALGADCEKGDCELETVDEGDGDGGAGGDTERCEVGLKVGDVLLEGQTGDLKVGGGDYDGWGGGGGG